MTLPATDWTIVRVKRTVLAQLRATKIHPNVSDNEAIDNLLKNDRGVM